MKVGLAIACNRLQVKQKINMQKRQTPPRIRGAAASLKRDRRSAYWTFKRQEAVRGFPKEMPGAAQHLASIENLKKCPERLTKKINVLEGLELHEGFLTTEEERDLVSTSNLLSCIFM